MMRYDIVQPTRKPTAAQRGLAARSRSDRRFLVVVVVIASLLQAATWAWHVAYAEDAEKAIGILRKQLQESQDEVREAELALSAYQLEEQRRMPQD